MKILLLSQVFYPDNVSVSQHLTDLSIFLTKKGNTVSVFTSKYPYESKDKIYTKFENYKGIKILRVNQTRFGKSKNIFRLIDFLTFYISIFFKLISIRSKEYDVIIGTSVPPMLAVIGVFVSKIKKNKFYYWVMDLQPELSISSGLIKKKSLIAKLLILLGNYSIRNSEKLFSLDKYMSQYLISRGANLQNIFTNPPWPVLTKIYSGQRRDNPFRIKNNFEDKIVVMYSGNHAFVHPLETLLESAKILRDNKNFLFVFIGEGVRKKDVTNFKNNHHLDNIVQLPFQPREKIHLSLGSSDLQVVIMGENQVGYTHPNKVYGGLFIGKPILYIGPKNSHVSDILNELMGNISVNHGEESKLAKQLLNFSLLKKDTIDRICNRNKQYAYINFHPEKLMSDMYNQISVNE